MSGEVLPHVSGNVEILKSHFGYFKSCTIIYIILGLCSFSIGFELDALILTWYQSRQFIHVFSTICHMCFTPPDIINPLVCLISPATHEDLTLDCWNLASQYITSWASSPIATWLWVGCSNFNFHCLNFVLVRWKSESKYFLFLI